MAETARTPLGAGRLGLIGRLVRDQGARQWRRYVLAFAFMGVVAAGTAASAWLMKDVIDRVFIARELAAVWAIAGALIAISIVKGFAAYGQQVTLSRVANAIVADLQRRIFSKMLDLSVGYFAARHSTDFIARQSFIVQSASSALNLLITAVARDALTLAGLVFVMVLQEPMMSALALTVMPLAVVGTRKLSGRVRKVVLTEFAGFGRIMEALQETAQGIRVVKAYTLEGVMAGRQEAAIASFEKAANKLAMVGARSSPMMEALGGLAIAAVVMYGGWRVIVGGQAPGAFFSFITALLLAYEPAKRLARLHVDLSSALVGVGLLYEFLDEPADERDEDGAPDLEVRGGRVEFEAVSFEYRPGEPVLRRLDLVAEAGQTTALVGPSGGGKSTVMSLLLRYWQPQAGAIRVDGQDIGRVCRRSLRRSVSYVGQENFLFGGTVRENIALGRPGATEGEIVAAAKAAHAHDFITGFERGYDTPCGEQGLQLSGGQRQRIAIARAFLKDAPILLLDEATSALDAESERSVQAALERLREGRTTLVIAHRLATVRGADRIYVLEGGAVRETGRHDELVAAGGAYAAMARAQFGPATTAA